MVMTALVDGKQRYSTVYSSVTANATMLVAAIAKEEQEKSVSIPDSFCICGSVITYIIACFLLPELL
jgi:hypothetical protein